MCGIFGVVPASTDVTPDELLLRQSARRLTHRGPDSDGVYVSRGIGLAQTRLALLDLNPRASQPFWDDSKTTCIVYNGEVYNFAALRSELARLGLSFRTTSDTEVVLKAIGQWGVDEAVSRLEGMFAFAVWNADMRELTLVRDRFGIKPLLLARAGHQLIFTSEAGALRPWMSLRPDLRSVYAFLCGSGGPVSGQTFIEDVSYVPPGSIVRLRPGRPPSVSQYFEMAELRDPLIAARSGGSSEESLIDTVESLLSESVEQQLIADASVGVLCSGGIDSSLILALAAKRHRDVAVFHADVVGPGSERGPASALAAHLGLDLQVVEVRDDDFIELLPKLSRHHVILSLKTHVGSDPA